MQKLQLVDLVTQHRKIRSELDEAIGGIIDKAAFVQGPAVKSFESELAGYLNSKHVLSCANGTDALQIALMALDLPKGAEVITTSFTFVATAEVICLLGLKPVLVDIDPETFNIDMNALKNAITDKTKAIIPVHLFGQCCDMDAIMKIANEHKLFVVEDVAQALGATYTSAEGKSQKAGTIGHIGTTSFFPSKNLSCMGDGGAIFTNDDALADKINMIRNHGQSSHYIYETIGVNSRLDGIQAAVLSIKLKYLNDYNRARQNAAAVYDQAFRDIPELTIPQRYPDSDHIFHQYTLTVNDGRRDELHEYLNKAGIPNKVYYPVPLHLHSAYKELAVFDKSALNVSEEMSERVISLPMHTELTDEHLSLITSKVAGFFK